MEKRKYKATVILTVTYTAYEHNAHYDAVTMKDFAIDGVCQLANEDMRDAFVTGAVSYEGV